MDDKPKGIYWHAPQFDVMPASDVLNEIARRHLEAEYAKVERQWRAIFFQAVAKHVDPAMADTIVNEIVATVRQYVTVERD